VGGVLFAGRLIHGLGLSHGKSPGVGRLVGMALTVVALAAAAMLLIVCPLLA
jgi:hypothetical protein